MKQKGGALRTIRIILEISYSRGMIFTIKRENKAESEEKIGNSRNREVEY